MVTFTTKYRGRDVPVPSKQINAAADKLSPRNRARLAVEVELEMRKYLHRVASALITRHSRKWSYTYRGPDLQRRSGKGLTSVKNFIVKREAEDVAGHMRLNFYMAVHEHGAIVRARRSQYLTIPLEAALDANGIPKKRSARDWRNTFIAKSRAGNLIIFHREGRRITPLYVLKKRVRIPARLGLRKELSRQRPEFRRNVLERIRELAKTQRTR